MSPTLSVVPAVRPTRSAVSICACLAVLLASIGPLASRAAADTIGISGGVLIYGPEGAEVVSLSGATAGTDLILTGTSATIAFVTPGCAANGASSVRCALAGFSLVRIIGSGGDDVIDFSGTTGVNLELWGNGGADVLFGGSGDDIIFAGTGDDVVSGGGGDDVLLGEPGDDVLLGDAGDDVLLGGAGNDVLVGGAGNNILIQGSSENEAANASPSPLERPRAVPEPGTTGLLLSGAVSAFFVRKRRRV